MASDSDDNLWQKNSTRSSGSSLVADDLRRLVENHWPWPQPKLGKPNPPINSSGLPALSEFEAKAFAEGVETAQDA
jgi:hypothetical protein